MGSYLRGPVVRGGWRAQNKEPPGYLVYAFESSAVSHALRCGTSPAAYEPEAANLESVGGIRTVCVPGVANEIV